MDEMAFPLPAQNNPQQVPMIYVREDLEWEYRRVVRNLAKENPPTEEELNALGKDGWEMAAAFSDSPFAYFYFKRMVS